MSFFDAPLVRFSAGFINLGLGKLIGAFIFLGVIGFALLSQRLQLSLRVAALLLESVDFVVDDFLLLVVSVVDLEVLEQEFFRIFL